MTRQHILLVDKDPEVRALLSQMLSEAGYSVSTAVDALSALDAARRNRPDCISLDMDLPTPGGTVFYARLRRDRALRDTPVVVHNGCARLPNNVPTIARACCPASLLETVNRVLA